MADLFPDAYRQRDLTLEEQRKRLRTRDHMADVRQANKPGTRVREIAKRYEALEKKKKRQ